MVIWGAIVGHEWSCNGWDLRSLTAEVCSSQLFDGAVVLGGFIVLCWSCKNGVFGVIEATYMVPCLAVLSTFVL